MGPFSLPHQHTHSHWPLCPSPPPFLFHRSPEFCTTQSTRHILSWYFPIYHVYLAPPTHDIVPELVPEGQRREARTRELCDWGEVEAVRGAVYCIERYASKDECDERGGCEGGEKSGGRALWVLGSMENCLLFVSFSSPSLRLEKKKGRMAPKGGEIWAVCRWYGIVNQWIDVHMPNRTSADRQHHCPCEPIKSSSTTPIPACYHTPPIIQQHILKTNAYPPILKPQPHPPSAPSSSQFPTRQPQSPDPYPATASAPPPVRSCPQSK